MLEQMFFQGWEPLLRTAIGTTATYLALVVLLRVAGQRTLAKWYAFDLIVTVALGSTFANGVLSKDVTIAIIGGIRNSDRTSIFDRVDRRPLEPDARNREPVSYAGSASRAFPR